MISIIHKECQGLPYLELIEEDKKDRSLPLIVFYHGWTGRKENNLPKDMKLRRRAFGS